MKKLIFVFLAVVLTLVIYAKVNSYLSSGRMIVTGDREKLLNTKFPAMSVETLSGNKIELPNYSIGKPTVICLVFEQDAQRLVDTWTKPILEKYNKAEVNYYEIPMISAGYKFMSGFIDKGMRGGVPEELHNNVATYYGALEQYKTDLIMSDKSSCYLFVLDKDGIIKHIDESFSNDQKLDTLFKAIQPLF
jgi:hypothetical protein